MSQIINMERLWRNSTNFRPLLQVLFLRPILEYMEIWTMDLKFITAGKGSKSVQICKRC